MRSRHAAEAASCVRRSGGGEREGQFARIMGRAARHKPQAITLDDGSGPARICFPEELGWRRPYAEIGEVSVAERVVGQYTHGAPWEGGHRLIPRFETDASDSPMFWPVTRRDEQSNRAG